MEVNGNGAAASRQETEAVQQLQTRLSEPHTLEAMNHLLDRIGTLEKALEKLSGLMEQGPGLLAMAGDTADETYRRAEANGISIDQRLHNALIIAEKLTTTEVVEKLDALLRLSDQLPGIVAMTMDVVDEGMKKAVDHGFNPKILASVAGAANTALTEAYAEHPAPSGGIFRLLSALRDPDRQKGLGFFLNFLKHFGQNL